MEEKLKEVLEENECLIADGLDDALIGVTDKDVVIFESEAKYFACVKYGGYSNSNKFDTHSDRPRKKLKDLNIEMMGDIFYVSYNSPYKIFNRRNEAMVEINYKN